MARGRGWDPEDDLNLAEIEDPEDDLNLAEIEDPEDDLNLAEIEDPEDDLNLAEIEDPQFDRWGNPIVDPWGTVAVRGGGPTGPWGWGPAWGGGGCCCDDSSDSGSDGTELAGCTRSGFVIVRLARSLGIAEPPGSQIVEEPQGPVTGGIARQRRNEPGDRGESESPGSLSHPVRGDSERTPDVQRFEGLVRQGTEFSGSLDEVARGHGLEGLAKALRIEEESGNAPGPSQREYFPSWPLIRNVGVGDTNRRIQVHQLEQQAATGLWPPMHSLLDYWRVDVRDHRDQLEAVRDRLQAQNGVDVAYVEFEAKSPSVRDLNAPAATTLLADQHYLGPAPDGIDARWARRWLEDPPEPVTLVDLEQSWGNHFNLPFDVRDEDLWIFGKNRADEGHSSNHGIAVCGELVADKAKVGSNLEIQGIAQGVAKIYLASHFDRIPTDAEGETEAGTGNPGDHRTDCISGNVAEAIVASIAPATGKLHHGDVLLLEVQRCRLPTEIDPADLDAIRLACSAGITVVEAAGNGGYDLDRVLNPEGRRTLARGTPEFIDSGAILVGAAATARPHNRIRSSNHGRAVRVWADGESVVTCGYGDLLGGHMERIHLTDTFSGTSAASAIIAGAAVLLQSLAKQHVGEPLPPARLRGLLADRGTGTPQGRKVPGHIGRMPNLRALLEDRLAWAPCVSLRNNPCDDGGESEARWLRSGDLWSSPDIFMTKTPQNIHRYIRGLLLDPAPGQAWLPEGEQYGLYTRLRNLGTIPAKDLEIKYFQAPPATWVPPSMWQEIEGDPASIPARIPTLDAAGVWTLSPAVPLPAGQNGNRQFSWLAVVGGGPYDEELELPPGGQYFDSRAYRHFLASKRVACRNVYRARPNNLSKVRFFVAGAPDRARTFDFEILQRLPSGVQVRWTLEPDLALKLHRSLRYQPSRGPGVATLAFPAQSRLKMRRVMLQRGACHPVELSFVSDPPGLPQPHHYFVVRQLYRGREWGRITFYF